MRYESEDIQTYMFVFEECETVLVEGTNESNALIRYCRWQGLSGTPMEAVCSLSFDSAVWIANHFLDEKIRYIACVGNVFFDDKYVSHIKYEEEKH